MPAGKNINIITKCKVPKTTTGSCIAIGSSVAVGMKRYVTFLHISRIEGASGKGAKLWVCSTAASQTASTDTAASAAAKMVLLLASASAPGNLSIPESIDETKPLFSIAASKFLTIREGSTAAKGNCSLSVFIQYYDQ